MIVTTTAIGAIITTTGTEAIVTTTVIGAIITTTGIEAIVTTNVIEVIVTTTVIEVIDTPNVIEAIVTTTVIEVIVTTTVIGAIVTTTVIGAIITTIVIGGRCVQPNSSRVKTQSRPSQEIGNAFPGRPPHLHHQGSKLCTHPMGILCTRYQQVHRDAPPYHTIQVV